jgi:cytidylate kinase
MVVAIDGPAGAGKSTVARALADKLRFSYLDSGAMYRAAAVALDDGAGGHLGQRAAELDIRLGERVVVGGRDVTEAIRTAEASEAASRIATVRSVRDALVERQRKMLVKGDWVAEGRDIGTVVCPEAELKVFLTASPEERAKRRADQQGADWRAVLHEQTVRDEQDSTREHSPLRAAVDAIEIDSTDRTVEDVVSQIAGLARTVKK